MKKKINQWACYNRILSWSPMPCEKHGPRASVPTKTWAFGLGFCLLSPSGHVFHTAWETMIKSYTTSIAMYSDNPMSVDTFYLFDQYLVGRGMLITIHFRLIHGLVFNYVFTWVVYHPISHEFMMTSSNRIIFCVTGPVWGEFTGHRWIPSKMASDVELWCFLWSAPEQTVEWIIKTSVYETPLRSLWRHRNAFGFISLLWGWWYYSSGNLSAN